MSDDGRKSDGLISEELNKRVSLMEDGSVSVGVAGTATIVDEPPTSPKQENVFFGSSGKNKCAFDEVCTFLSAVMRKSYGEALTLANQILEIEPNNRVVEEFVPVLKEIIAEEEKQSGDLMSTSDSDSSARSESEEEEDEEEFEEGIEVVSSSSASETSESEEEGSTESSESGSSAESISSGSETSDTSIDEELNSFDSTLSMLHDDKDEEDEAAAEDSDDDGYET